MALPPVAPIPGVTPVSPEAAALRLAIITQTSAVLGSILDSGAGAEAPVSGKAGTTTPAPPAAPAPSPAAAPPSPLAQAVDTARAAAAQRQGGLSPLFADLAQVAASPTLPPALRAAIGQVLALRTPLSGPLTAETVRQAVAQSGLFLEAHLAQTPPGAPAPPLDLKAALLILQTALATVPADRTPAPPLTTTAPPTTTTLATTTPSAPPPASPANPPAAPAAPSAEPAATPPASPTPSPQPAPAVPTDPRAALLNLQAVPAAKAAVLSPAPGAVTTPPPATSPELGPRPTLLDQGPEVAIPGRPAPSGPTPDPAAAVPPPPHRAAALAAQPALSSSLPIDAKAPAIVQHLQSAVEQAVARQTLHQLASLPDGQTTAWMFELPLTTPQGTAIAQFEIQRDGRGAQDGEEPANGWRLRFSIDIEPLGPLHVHLGLNGDHAQVKVWAERESSLQWLRLGAADLANALPAEVTFHPGAPRRPTPAPGRFLDQAL